MEQIHLLAKKSPRGLALDADGNAYISGALRKVYGGWDQEVVTVKYSGASGEELWRMPYEDAYFKLMTTGYPNNAVAVDSSGAVYTTFSTYYDGYGDYTTIKYSTASSEAAETVIWEETVPLSLTASEEWSDDPTVLGIQSDLAGATGKLLHSASLYNSSDQLIAQSDLYTFYVTDNDLLLTMETDKDSYYTGETVNVSGGVYNGGDTSEPISLTVTANGDTVYEDTFTVDPGETHAYGFSFEAVETFILQASAGGVAVYDEIDVQPHGLTLEISAPDTVGLDPFDTVLTVDNQSANDYVVDISFAGSTWEDQEIFTGSALVLVSSISITGDTEITAVLSGPLTLTETKTIVMGESATLEVNPKFRISPGQLIFPLPRKTPVRWMFSSMPSSLLEIKP
jgi:hypothetical protein